MRLGLQINRFIWPGGDAAIGPTFAAVVQRAEEAGFASVWVMDHFFQIAGNGAAEDPLPEAYAALAFAAGVTKRVRLGTMVTGVTYRYPGVLVKTATTLDVLSGGRAYLGIGAAWYEREHHGLGVPYPPLGERFERLEETLQIAKQMWSGDVTPYQGKHYQLAEPICQPQPLSKPHPPIMIGGGGERKTLRLVAQYGDACNLFHGPGLEQVRHKLDVLKEHCEALGRPYGEIEKTTLGGLAVTRDGRNGTNTPAQALDQLGRLAELGIDQTLITLPNYHEPEALEIFGTDVVPAAAKLNVAGR